MIVFDIETGPLPDEELQRLIPAFDERSVKCGNIKDPEKIAAKIAEAKAEHEATFVERAALSAITGRVLAIGYRSERGTAIAHVAEIESGETGLLQQFWQRYRGCRSDRRRLVGHNIAGFDVPFVIRRSWVLGISIPDTVFAGRYLDQIFVDTMQIWQCSNYRDAFVSLDSLAKVFGLGAKTDGITGADFARLYYGTPEERTAALEYLRNDIELTYQVAVRLGVA